MHDPWEDLDDDDKDYEAWYEHVLNHRLGVSLGSSQPFILEYHGGPLDGDLIMGIGNSASCPPSSSVTTSFEWEHHYTRVGGQMYYLGGF